MFDNIRLLSLVGVAGVLEFAGGILLFLGVFTRPVAFILSAKWRSLTFIAHAQKSFFPIPMEASLRSSIALSCFISPRRAAARGVLRATGLRRLPFDRTADRWSIHWRYARCRDAPHGLDKLSPRALWRRHCAAFVQAATVF